MGGLHKKWLLQNSLRQKGKQSISHLKDNGIGSIEKIKHGHERQEREGITHEGLILPLIELHKNKWLTTKPSIEIGFHHLPYKDLVDQRSKVMNLHLPNRASVPVVEIHLEHLSENTSLQHSVIITHLAVVAEVTIAFD